MNKNESICNKYNIYTSKELCGFRLISIQYIEDIKSSLLEFIHIKTKAKLIFLENDDENKVFSIAFKTPAKDNNGANHILEHCVLCGSRKYPVKDPFLIMNKQSLQTFLNAYTGCDYTMFPVGSKNEKDLFNLMDIYLDAVFYPNIYKEKKIFKQEGYRYELFNENDEIKYNGIVYNEMKGEYSSANMILINEINKSLFPDTRYKNEFGGHPDSIINLSYEDLLYTHKKYYVPSNSQIYLYGNLDITKALKFIDDNYLKFMKETNNDIDIQLQKKFEETKKVISFYNTDENVDMQNMTYISFNYVLGKIEDTKTIIGLQILSDLLTGNFSSPLKKAFEKNKIGYNLYSSYDYNSIEHTFSIICENANENDEYKFEEILKKVLEDIVKNGFDEDLLEAVFNTYDINIRFSHNDAQRGMAYNDILAMSFVHSNSPVEYLNMSEKIEYIRSKTKENYFENLINTYLINNLHSSLVILNPKEGLEETKEKSLRKNLLDYKNSLSKEEINNLIKESNDLIKWQDREDSKENIDKIPSLSIKDIDIYAQELPLEIKSINNIKVLYHDLFCNKVDYINLYFDSSKINQEDILYLNLLANSLGELNTINYSASQIANNISKYTGEINFECCAFADDSGKIYPKLLINMSSIEGKLSKAFDTLDEIISSTIFDDEDLLKNIIQSEKSDMENDINENAQEIAISKLGSYLSDLGQYDCLLKVNYYEFLCEIDKNFETKFEEIKDKLINMQKIIFNKDDLIVSYTGDNYCVFEDNFYKFSLKLKDMQYEKKIYNFNYDIKNEAFIISSKVQYISKGGSLEKGGYKYTGVYKVLENILNNEFLWKNVRVKGGAYGSEVSISSKDMHFLSYRDPHLKRTLSIYDDVVEYIKNFKADEKDMTNFIIGAIASVDMPISPSSKGYVSDVLYLSGKEKDYIQNIRDDILNTTSDDIRNCSKMLEDVINQNFYFVLGNRKKIMESKELFENIKFILK